MGFFDLSIREKNKFCILALDYFRRTLSFQTTRIVEERSYCSREFVVNTRLLTEYPTYRMNFIAEKVMILRTKFDRYKSNVIRLDYSFVWLRKIYWHFRLLKIECTNGWLLQFHSHWFWTSLTRYYISIICHCDIYVIWWVLLGRYSRYWILKESISHKEVATWILFLKLQSIP